MTYHPAPGTNDIAKPWPVRDRHTRQRKYVCDRGGCEVSTTGLPFETSVDAIGLSLMRDHLIHDHGVARDRIKW